MKKAKKGVIWATFWGDLGQLVAQCLLLLFVVIDNYRQRFEVAD